MEALSLLELSVDGKLLCEEVDGAPTMGPWPVVAVSDTALATLRELREARGAARRRHLSRETVAREYARAHGRISTTELGSILHADPTNVGSILRRLEDHGALAPSRANRRGAGFYYRYIGEDNEALE